MASCRSTFSARLRSFTRTSAGDAAGCRACEGFIELRRRSDVAPVEPEAAGDLSDVGARRGPEEQLELVVLERPGLGQERKDPPSPVVQHDERAGDVGQVDQSGHVVQERQISEEHVCPST